MFSSNPAINEAEAMLRAIGMDRPIYLIDRLELHDASGYSTVADKEWIASATSERTIACTSPVMDLVFKETILRYSWRGRGFAALFARPALCRSRAQVLGSTLHEYAHYLADYSRPERDDTDEARAMAAFARTGIDKAKSHRREWLRATAHAWWRAIAAGYDLAYSEVCNLMQYDYEPEDCRPFMVEARDREHHSIESILRSPLPGTRRPKPKTAATKPIATAVPAQLQLSGESIRQRLQRHGLPSQLSAWCGGKLLELRGGQAFVDGKSVSLEHASQLHTRWVKGDADYCRARPAAK